MNTIGSHPGAILFRLSIMIVLIAILMVVFFRYYDDARESIELKSILQTKRIIDSSLAVVFASYAVDGRLAELNELDGGNPFVFLREFEILPPAYQGEIETGLHAQLAPGWYYLKSRKMVGYKSFYSDRDSYYAVVLNYEDLDGSGRYEPGSDRFQSLQFVEKRSQ